MHKGYLASPPSPEANGASPILKASKRTKKVAVKVSAMKGKAKQRSPKPVEKGTSARPYINMSKFDFHSRS